METSSGTGRRSAISSPTGTPSMRSRCRARRDSPARACPRWERRAARAGGARRCRRLLQPVAVVMPVPPADAAFRDRPSERAPAERLAHVLRVHVPAFDVR